MVTTQSIFVYLRQSRCWTRHIAPSREQWRISGPHRMPPVRFAPSPTSGDSSLKASSRCCPDRLRQIVHGVTLLQIQDVVGMSIKMIERYCRLPTRRPTQWPRSSPGGTQEGHRIVKSYSAEPKKLRKSNVQHYGPNTTACMMRPGSNVNTPAMTSAPMKRDTMASRCLRTA
jgi:hypothetical protein